MELLGNITGKYNGKYQHTKVRDFVSYDFQKKIKPQSRFLTPVSWALSLPAAFTHYPQITKDLRGVKPPYLLLCNHNSFLDFKIMTQALFPRRANYVVALDAFPGRETLLRSVGAIAKRKFTNDIGLVRQMLNLIKEGQIVVLYPEARYSIDGSLSTLPDSLGKLVKLLKVPVVTLVMHGHHVAEPMWNQSLHHNVPVQAELKTLFSAEETQTLDYQTINAEIRKALWYDDWQWRRDNKIPVQHEQRAEGIHKVLYKCPVCQSEDHMDSKGTTLFCKNCHSEWFMDPFGVLHGKGCETRFPFVPDWYRWEREEVRNEIEAGTYHVDTPCVVDALPNSQGFVDLGPGRLIHDMNEVRLIGHHAGEDYEAARDNRGLYSIHIELNYTNRKLDCVDLSTNEQTFFAYPTTHVNVVKISLAVEELYFYYQRQGENR